MKTFSKFFLASLTVIIPFIGAQAAENDFDALYAKSDSLSQQISTLIYHRDVRPFWKDNTTFLYSTQGAEGESVYEVNAQTGKQIPALKDSLNALMKRSRHHEWEDPSDESYFSMRENVKETSPDGKWVAFVQDNNVWVQPAKEEKKPEGDFPPMMRPGHKGFTASEEAVQLSFDGTEADCYVQLMWSPDSKKLAALRKEKMKERQILLRESRPSDQIQPKYRWLDYAKPGDALPQETPALFDVATKKQIHFDTTPYSNQYFLELGQWSANSDYFTFEYNQRGHQLYQLVAVDAETGVNRILAEEKTNTFVYYYDLYRYYFEDGRRILWISERDNWRHLYLIDAAGGEMKQLTKGEWNVREIQHVDEDNGIILFYANGRTAIHEKGDAKPGQVSAAGKNGHGQGEDPYNKHLVKLDMKSGKLTDLTPENGYHQVSFNEEHTYFVDNYSRPDMAGKSVVRSVRDGSLIAELQTADISELVKKTGFTMPEVFTAKARDGKTDIWGTIYKPCNFNPSRKYKVVEYIYAGPHDSHVDKQFLPYVPRFYRLMELGFVVVCIDGMGTDNRSKAFQDVAWRNIKDAGFEDRILWMKAAAEQNSYMDISCVGIYGYSAGGQNTLSALLFHPEFYKVGVALCGCHDNRMDKIWWNEQWMGYPVGPWYSESSNVDNAYRLEGKLFIINGEMDDNVDPASTLQVVSELVKNGKDFQQLYLPGYTHNLSAPYITRRAFKFFYENCR